MSPIDVAVAGAAQPPEGADPFSLGDAEAAALILDGAGFDDCASCTSARKSRAPNRPTARQGPWRVHQVRFGPSAGVTPYTRTSRNAGISCLFVASGEHSLRLQPSMVDGSSPSEGFSGFCRDFGTRSSWRPSVVRPVVVLITVWLLALGRVVAHAARRRACVCSGSVVRSLVAPLFVLEERKT